MEELPASAVSEPPAELAEWKKSTATLQSDMERLWEATGASHGDLLDVVAAMRRELEAARTALRAIAAIPAFPSKDIADRALGVQGPDWEPRAKKEWEARKGGGR